MAGFTYGGDRFGATYGGADGGTYGHPSFGIPQTRTGSKGWMVKLELSTGEILRPRIVGEPEWLPTVNGLPRVRIPVPHDEKWLDPAYDRVAMTVWFDGTELPIDRLENIEHEADHTILEGLGGVELRGRVQKEVTNTESHVTAEEIIDAETSYTSNVDDPATTTQNDSLMQEADTTSELSSKLATTAADQPVEVVSGKVRSKQTCFVSEAGGHDRGDGFAIRNDDNYSGGQGLTLSSNGDFLEWDFTIDYTIPSSSVGVKVRDDDTGSSEPPDFSWYLNDDKLTEPDTLTDVSLSWQEIGDGSGFYGGTGWDGGDLTPGTYTLRVQIDAAGTDDYVVDVVALYDQRFSYTFDNDNGGAGGYLDGPQLYPDQQPARFSQVTTAFNVIGARVDSTWDNISNSQALEVSNDGGVSWLTASNTETLDKAFSSAGGSIEFRSQLSRHGTRTTATPQTGYLSQELDDYQLYADLDDTPIIDDARFDGQIVDVLNSIADDHGNFLWEVTRAADGTTTIEWTQPGVRTGTLDAALADFKTSKRNEDKYLKAVIHGSSAPVVRDSFTSDVGTFVALDKDDLVAGKEAVYDPSTGTNFDRGTDYEMDYSAGEIKVKSGGSMSDATTYNADYHYNVSGEHTSPSAPASPEPLVRDIPALTTDRACKSAALYLVQKLDEPLWTARVTLPRDQPGRSLVDDLLVERLPAAVDRMTTNGITHTAADVVLELGSRRGVEQEIANLNQRVATVSRQT